MTLAARLQAALLLREDYEDHELVDPDTLDLVGEYRRLNQKLFDGKLGTYPMKWNTRKNSLARVISTGDRKQPGTHSVKVIEFSKLFELTYRQFLDRLAHEMIHVKRAESGHADIGGDHGVLFKAEMNRINQLGFNVTTSELLPPGVKLRSGKNKTLVAVLLQQPGKRTALITTQKNWEKFRDDMAAYPQGFLERFEIYFMLTDHGELQQFPVKLNAPPKNKKFVSYVLPDEVWTDIRNNGRRLASIVHGRVT